MAYLEQELTALRRAIDTQPPPYPGAPRGMLVERGFDHARRLYTEHPELLSGTEGERAGIDLSAVSDAMLALEDQREDPNPMISVGEVAAKLLGVEHSTAFDAGLGREVQRIKLLLDTYYANLGVKYDEAGIAALAFTQGIAFAVAVRKVRTGT